MSSRLAPARLIALGSAVLMEGFALIGFETYADPTADHIEKLMQALLVNQQTALVVIEQGLARQPGPFLLRVQQEGGRIVITEIPEISQSSGYHSRVEKLVQHVLGSQFSEKTI
jgi:vacuolar-type H+-ATPase subunit F/Vma7